MVLFNCACRDVPEAGIEWGIGKYILYYPDWPFELEETFDILGRFFSELELYELWEMIMHQKFCPSSWYAKKEATNSTVLECLREVKEWVYINGRTHLHTSSSVFAKCQIIHVWAPRQPNIQI